MTANALVNAVTELRDARVEALAAKAEWDAAQEAFQKQQALVHGRHVRASAAMREADERVRALALEDFALYHEPKPVPGVELKRFEVLEYEAAAAIDWAKAHELWWLLKLDAGAFEKMAKAGAAAMPFVTVKEDWRPQIASVLP